MLSKGFSLVELSAILLISTCILLTSYWGLNQLRQRQQFKTTVQQFSEFLQTAKLHARQSQQTILIKASPKNPNQWLQFRDLNHNQQQDSDEPTLAQISVSPKIKVNYRGFPSNKYQRFNASEILSQSNGRYSFSLGQLTQALVISKTGRIRID